MDMSLLDSASWEVFSQFGIAGLMLGVLLIVVCVGIWMVKSIVRELSKDDDYKLQDLLKPYVKGGCDE